MSGDASHRLLAAAHTWEGTGAGAGLCEEGTPATLQGL